MVIPLSRLTLILVVVCFFIARLADCCNRTPPRPVRPVPPPEKPPATSAPSAVPSPSAAASTVEPSSPPPARTHRLPCTGPEIQTTACLNKGTCFAVIIENTRQAFCRCPEQYSGRRCQDAQLPPGIFFSMENIQTANIATGATVTIIILVVILLSLYVYVRWRKKARQTQTTLTTSQPMTRASSVRSMNGVDAIRNPALSSSYRSSQYSISSHPALSKSKESLDPGGPGGPAVNGAGYYNMQEVPPRTPERTSPWLQRNRSYGRNSGRYMRHSQTDHVINPPPEANWPRTPNRSPSETTV